MAKMAGKKTEGRKKIKMKKIENEGARRITFSKRRSGLFKKASELSTLCGVQIAIIIYSIGGKAFSFGHPSVESLINRFENAYQPQQDYITRCVNSIRKARLGVLNQRFNQLNEKIAQERKRGKMVKRNFDRRFGCESFQEYIDKLGSDDLKQVKEKMLLLKEKLTHGGIAKQVNPCADKKDLNIGFTIPKGWLKL